MKIEVNVGSVRIDKFLGENLDYSRSKIQKLIKEELVLVNGKVVSSSYVLKENDVITIGEIEEEVTDIIPEEMDLDIVYEDEYLAIINKKSGIVVHPAVGNHSGTLVNGLLYHFNNVSKENSIRPGIVHRLDKGTSGLMVVAKNDIVHDKLANMIKDKKIERKYLALVWGVLGHEKGTIDAPIGRDLNNRQKYAVTSVNSKNSVTHFRVLKRFKDATLLECKLETGRTHQIRVHMDYINHPIVNDPVYGNRKLFNDFEQMLHSTSIKFIHPITNVELYYTARPPKEFLDILSYFE